MIFLLYLGMEKCFAYFGLPNQDGIAGPMGVNDEQVQLQELEDIETTMPDAKIVMIEPNPIGNKKLNCPIYNKKVQI